MPDLSLITHVGRTCYGLETQGVASLGAYDVTQGIAKIAEKYIQ